MKFLFLSTHAFIFFPENRDLLSTEFQGRVYISNASSRNSGAVLALLVFFFMPHVRERLQMVQQFISLNSSSVARPGQGRAMS